MCRKKLLRAKRSGINFNMYPYIYRTGDKFNLEMEVEGNKKINNKQKRLEIMINNNFTRTFIHLLIY